MRAVRLLVLLVGSAVLLLSLPGCGSDDSAPSPADAPKTNLEAQSEGSYQTDPQPVPDTTLQTLDGSSIDLGAQDGGVLLVNFWATWCAPCRKEIPDLVELQETLGEEGLTVIGVSLDKEGESAVRPFLGKYDVNYPIVLDPEGNVDSLFGATYGLPTTYVVNPSGQVVRRIVGIFPTDAMRPRLKSMLQSDSTPDSA